MAKEKLPFDVLKEYLPNNSFEMVMPLILKHKVHLTITQERQTKLGDYRNAHTNKNHRISVNGNLNKFSFLITLVHEIAHLLAYEQYGHTIPPHGKEWKKMYADLLKAFLQVPIFPQQIVDELIQSLQNPGASSCAEEGLMRVLRNYDVKKTGLKTIEEIPAGNHFVLTNGRAFLKGEKLRKRYKCKELATNKFYLFSALFEVLELQ